jgi:hypothetical protein
MSPEPLSDAGDRRLHQGERFASTWSSQQSQRDLDSSPYQLPPLTRQQLPPRARSLAPYVPRSPEPVSRSPDALNRVPEYTPNFAPARPVLRREDSQSQTAEERVQERGSVPRMWRELHSRPSSFTPRPSDLPPPPPLLSQYAPYPDPEGLQSMVDEDRDEDTQAADAVGDFPPLRRMSRRAIADGPLPPTSLRESWSPDSYIDGIEVSSRANGLGDREHSLSPEPEWDTMLTTIQPDTSLPSADSSFTTAAASASFSNSNSSSRSGSANSASSSRTHLTVPSLLNEEEIACVYSDSGSDTEADGEDHGHSGNVQSQTHFASLRDATRPRMGHFRRSFQDRTIPTLRRSQTQSPTSPPESPRMDGVSLHRRTRRRDRDARRFMHSYRSFTSRAGSREGSVGGGSAAASFGSSLSETVQMDPDLEQMRSVLGRLARREDIPEEFWMSAGLTRGVGENVVRAVHELRARAERLERRLDATSSFNSVD